MIELKELDSIKTTVDKKKGVIEFINTSKNISYICKTPSLSMINQINMGLIRFNILHDAYMIHHDLNKKIIESDIETAKNLTICILGLLCIKCPSTKNESCTGINRDGIAIISDTLNFNNSLKNCQPKS